MYDIKDGFVPDQAANLLKFVLPRATSG